MRPRPLPAQIRDRPFDVRTARRLGVSDERLRRRDLAIPTRGLRWHVGAEPVDIHRVRAFVPILREDAFFSHTTAAMLWGLPLPRSIRRDRWLHVTAPLPAAQMRRPGVIGHRVRPDRVDVAERWGVPVSSPAQTFVECGSMLGLHALVALGDAIVSDSRCLTSIDDLRRAVDSRPRARGIVTLRAALEYVRVGAGSARETDARLAIVDAGLPEPALQVVIRDEHGQFVGRVDMAYVDQRIVIEYEGDHHRTDARQWGNDVRRYRELERLGWTVLRWTNSDLREHRAAALRQLAVCLGAE
jgi:hypothetical protein